MVEDKLVMSKKLDDADCILSVYQCGACRGFYLRYEYPGYPEDDHGCCSDCV